MESGHMYWIFLLVMLIIGITLVIVNFQIDKNIDYCQAQGTIVPEKVRHSNKGILIIGIVAIAFSLSNGLCTMKMGEYGQLPEVATEIYIGIMLILSIILVVLGTIVKDLKCQKPISVEPAAIVISAGSIMLTVSLVYFFLYFGLHSKIGEYFPKKSSF